MKNIFAFGDIHGCLDKLIELIKLVEISEDDTCVFLGDYINRGPDSFGVVEYLIGFSRKFKNSVFLMGNHEYMFLDYIDGLNRGKFLLNGGGKVVEEYTKEGNFLVPDSHVKFIRGLLPFYVLDETAFVHAGFRPGVELEKNQLKDYLWIREEFYSSDYSWGKTIIFGHSVFAFPYVSNSMIGIDTGACFAGGSLTCLDVQSGEYWNV